MLQDTIDLQLFDVLLTQSLKKLNHPNIVKLREVIREKDILYMVFEAMENNLYELMKDRKTPFPESEVKSISFQVMDGLAYMHKLGELHSQSIRVHVVNAILSAHLLTLRESNLLPCYENAQDTFTGI